MSAVSLSGCASYEINTQRGNIPGLYIRQELQQADRAVEAARQAGKNQTCPAEFKAAEAARDKAYDVYRACHTEEGVALANEATAKAQALCPPQAPKVVPPPVEPPAPKPAPVAPAPVAPPPAPAPTDTLSVAPASIVKGESATLTWNSQNATRCQIAPGIGAVETSGSLKITPAEATRYELSCSGAGGSAVSTTEIAVTQPAPVVVPAPKLCSPTVVDVQFDTNKFDIKAKYHAELKKLADFLAEFPKAHGVIEGHTDSVGDQASNMKLSQRRADSVRNYLIKNFGVAPERLQAKGYGPTRPRATNKTAEGKAQNRRIEANFICD
ncbi:OmpA family protein [Geomonas limicola]|uniref:OmpA family protein n=1 Tax=Geomonas limicola TaxID=2740186 RepID=UPI001FE2A3B3|nr:OmpA family protein [Geomonas limicola]